FLRVQSHYQMLRVGAALSDEAGPLVVSSSSSSTARGFAVSSLPSLRFAIPGELTTAHLLLKLWCPDIHRKIFVPYDRVIPLVVSGGADAGVIIHESRFTYRQAGLHLLADLGEWWLAKTHLPIPLACIAARRSLGASTIAAFESLLRESISRAQADPAAAGDYIRRHAQEMDGAVLDQHIRTYVNRFSLDLGAEGQAAVDTLIRLAEGLA
ncbi:MAG: 1,4-dihydroxy-6-naphthoate synthase, partial [Planctomycetota bacterium]|nr:1,4-dihydroxy-6-naphthoate synthase [Planctomycetota bacterium]